MSKPTRIGDGVYSLGDVTIRECPSGEGAAHTRVASSRRWQAFRGDILVAYGPTLSACAARIPSKDGAS